MGSESGGVGIGARLRAARERKALTVLQAAEKLHVDARLLEALESDDFASLGGDVYVRGHLRRYAELLGESGADLQALYSGTTAAPAPDLTRIPRAPHSPESTRLLLPAMVTVVVFALAGVVWWLVSLPRTKAHPVAAVAQPLGAAANPPSPTPALPPPGLEPAVTGAVAPGAESAGAAAPAVPSGQARLALKFAEASWVKVWDAHGQALLDGLMASGTARVIEGAPPLRLVIGNAQAVSLEVNGRPVGLAGMIRRRGDAHFSLDADGRATASAASTREE
jgi:cytoskeleton protein RodZ